MSALGGVFVERGLFLLMDKAVELLWVLAQRIAPAASGGIGCTLPYNFLILWVDIEGRWE